MSDSSSGFGKYPLYMVALGLLMRGPLHGYGLFHDFISLFGQIWKSGQTKFYVELTDLEKRGMLTSELEPQEGRPPRKIYSLTDEGRRLFNQWLADPVKSLRGIRVECMAKLRFYDLLDMPGGMDFIDRQTAVITNMLTEWESENPAQGADAFHVLITDFRDKQARQILQWLETCKDYFSTKAIFS